mmetsp:Transcript_3334/g.7844  ORF Transcript_3334/g.7844 Transcript_3334/m.7844 type:complete len:245 (-) Transcript_3334:916-1650(-)
MAPEIPIAMYKLEATGFPVCPTCSPCGLHPKSETGLEHAVAAPNTSANSSIIPQFSGPFIPLPADTTTSASAIVTFPDTLSTDATFTPNNESSKLGAKDSAVAAPEFSTNPNELFETPIIFTSELSSVILNALFVNAVLFTVKGLVLVGAATTLEAYPASKFTAKIGANVLLSALELTITTFDPSCFAAWCSADAYALALKSFKLSVDTFKTLSTPYVPNSEASSTLTVTAVTVVPSWLATSFA